MISIDTTGPCEEQSKYGHESKGNSGSSAVVIVRPLQQHWPNTRSQSDSTNTDHFGRRGEYTLKTSVLQIEVMGKWGWGVADTHRGAESRFA